MDSACCNDQAFVHHLLRPLDIGHILNQARAESVQKTYPPPIGGLSANAGAGLLLAIVEQSDRRPLVANALHAYFSFGAIARANLLPYG
jgi:hypothetical protein